MEGDTLQVYLLAIALCVLTQCAHTQKTSIEVTQIISAPNVKRQFSAIKQKLLESLILNKKDVNEVVYIILFDRLMIGYSPNYLTKSLLDQFDHFFTQQEKQDLVQWNQHPLAIKLEKIDESLRQPSAQKKIEEFVNAFNFDEYEKTKTKRHLLEMELNQLGLSAHIMVAMRVCATIFIYVAKTIPHITAKLSEQEELSIVQFLKNENGLHIESWEKKILPITIYNHKDLTDAQLETYVKELKTTAFRKKEALEVTHSIRFVVETLMRILEAHIDTSPNGVIYSYLRSTFFSK